jgi:hypothetical protein
VVALVGFTARPTAAAAAEASGPAAVAVLALPGTPLADEIGRELRASHFDVVRIDVEVTRRAPPELAPAWPVGAERGDDPLSAVPAGLARGVLVSADERRVTVFERLAPSGELFSRTDLRVDPGDPQVRRHACFAVVEYLRVMTLGTGAPAADPAAASTDGARRPRAATAAAGDPPPGPVAASEAASANVPVLHPRPWTLGAAAKLDLDTGLGISTTGLEFVWHFGLGPHAGIRAFMIWPVVGANVTRADESIRLWAFGTGVGLHYAFTAPPTPIRPFIGVGLGTRLTLTQTSTAAMPENDGRVVLTPSLNLGLEAGLACRVARFAELFFDVGVTRDRLVPGLERDGLPAEAATALSLSSAIGVMFEY